MIPLPALLVLLAAGAPPGADRARCSPPQPRSLESPASFATDLVGSLGKALDGQLEWLRYLDSESRAGREPDPGTAEALLDKGVARKDEAAQAAAIAAVQGLDVVVEMRDGKPTGRLRRTRAERKKLEAAILGKFGETVRNGPGTENDFATNAAAGWYQVLSNEAFRSLDAP